MKRTAHQEVADTMTKALPLGLKSYFSSATVVTELAPLLVRIISPDLKPVNQQLVKSEDRQALRKLVKQMLDMNVSFVTDRNEEGQIIFKLEPQLDVFVHYEGKRAPDLPPARFNLRQLIAKELEAEAVRRAGGSEEVVEKGKQASDIINAYKRYVVPDYALLSKRKVLIIYCIARLRTTRLNLQRRLLLLPSTFSDVRLLSKQLRSLSVMPTRRASLRQRHRPQRKLGSSTATRKDSPTL